MVNKYVCELPYIDRQRYVYKFKSLDIDGVLARFRELSIDDSVVLNKTRWRSQPNYSKLLANDVSVILCIVYDKNLNLSFLSTNTISSV